MSSAVFALLAVGSLAGSWFAGYALETFLASPHCWPLVRRSFYAVAVAWMLVCLVRLALGV